MKPGIAANLKVKSNAKKSILLVVLGIWLFTILACSRSAGAQTGLSVTALAQLQTAILSPAPLNPPLASPTVTPIPPTPMAATPTFTADPPTPVVASPTSAPSPSQTSGEVPTSQGSNPDLAENRPVILYYTQAGDTLNALAVRFSVKTEEITSPGPIPNPGLFTPNQLLVITNHLIKDTGPKDKLLPDSEIVYSPSATNFDVKDFIQNAGGFLATYKEQLSTGPLTGDQVIKRVAIENSVNPRLLLAILEYQSHWVYSTPSNLAETDYPIGYQEYHTKGLYRQLSWAVQQLSIGYYSWRAGLITNLTFPQDPKKGASLRLAPELNAGSVAIQYLFSQLYPQREWGGNLYAPGNIADLYQKMFGNPWLRAQSVEPLYPPNLVQPKLDLPFEAGRVWSLTGGPHSAWGPDGALAAIDFAPAATNHGCILSNEWVRASTSGLVVRSENGVVTIDLDGDGIEQTGWVLLYLHIYHEDRVKAGVFVNAGDPIGHPSCEGGVATGTHTHFARKYNGEWILADGPVPFVLSGWTVHAGEKPYAGSLTKGDQVVTASQVGSFESRITRSPE